MSRDVVTAADIRRYPRWMANYFNQELIEPL